MDHDPRGIFLFFHLLEYELLDKYLGRVAACLVRTFRDGVGLSGDLLLMLQIFLEDILRRDKIGQRRAGAFLTASERRGRS